MKSKKEILTVPNLLSLFRLILIPVYIAEYLHAQTQIHYYLAGGILALSCVTDALDGYIARRFHCITTVGKILDPLADKLTQFAVTLCLTQRYPALVPILVLLVIKELFQLLAGFLHLCKGQMLSGALFAGKLSTAVLFVSLVLLVLFPDVPAGIVGMLSFINFLLLSISFLSYIMAYLGKHPEHPNAIQE